MLFFFFKQKTAYEMRISDWSSDVCSSDLSDQEVCIGDRYRIGGALFEVTQPRVTCYRIGIRMDEPQMAALLVAHGRPGFYFRVLEEGDVAAGDAIVQVAAGPERMTVFDVHALLYRPGHPRRKEIGRASGRDRG